MGKKTAEKGELTPIKKKSPWFRRIFVVLFVAFLSLQLAPVNRHNPEVVADLVAPDEVKSILKRACYDCHSNETRWPWYSYIAPGSWLMARDVVEGRASLNFSEWGDYYSEEEMPEMFLSDCWTAIDDKTMPLWFYLPLHPEANLTQEDLRILAEWCGAKEITEEAVIVEEEVMEEEAEEPTAEPQTPVETTPETIETPAEMLSPAGTTSEPAAETPATPPVPATPTPEPAESTPAATPMPAPATPPVETPPATPAPMPTPETSTPETSTPETSTPETSTPETSTPETSTPETPTPE